MIKMRLLKELLLVLLIMIHSTLNVVAQEKSPLEKYIITSDSLNNPALTVFFTSQVSKSQFVMIGEQHGIQEAGDFTNLIYNLGQAFDYKYLCIETDAIAAKQIENNAENKNAAKLAKENSDLFPFSIPFYCNSDDYRLFTNVMKNGGSIWGIDQTFMTQFRLNFAYLENTTSNKQFREEITLLKEKAIASFEKAMTEKDFMAPFIFQYSETLHNKLISLTQEDGEKEVLSQLKKTKEIYLHNFTKEYYLNNSKRAHLMKQNFLRYYKEAAKSDESPKVIFKLGANHVLKGLNSGNVYDISNLVSELAIMNDMKSTHILLQGIDGETAIGNPFVPTPTKSFDNTEDFPEEIQSILKKTDKKYFILDLSPLRENAKKYSNKMQDWMFKYDIVVLVKNTKPTTAF